MPGFDELILKRLQRLGLGTRYLYGLIATVLVVIAVLATRFLYLPLLARVGERQGILRDLRVKLADVHVASQGLPQQELQLREVLERHQMLERRLGRGQSVARVLETLNAMAKEAHLQLTAVQSPADETSSRDVSLGSETVLQEMPLTLQLTGRYRHVAEFLGELYQAPFVSSVKELAMTRPDAGSPRLRADVSLTVYLLRQETGG